MLCGNVGGGRLAVQVTSTAVRLLRGADLVQEVDLQLSYPVARASLEDPHLLIVSEKGEIVLLTLAEEVGSLTVCVVVN